MRSRHPAQQARAKSARGIRARPVVASARPGAVGSGTGAVVCRTPLGCVRRFRLRARLGDFDPRTRLFLEDGAGRAGQTPKGDRRRARVQPVVGLQGQEIGDRASAAGRLRAKPRPSTLDGRTCALALLAPRRRSGDSAVLRRCRNGIYASHLHVLAQPPGASGKDHVARTFR